MMAGTGFHSLSLFGDFLPALPRPPFGPKARWDMFFKKARIIEFTYIWLQTNGSICRPRCVIKCLQNCVCVGLGLSCRAWTTSVSLRKWLVKQLVLAKLSIMIPELVSCQYLVVVSQLCLKFHCVLLFVHLALKKSSTWLREASHRFAANI